jgi:hypothetical protein
VFPEYYDLLKEQSWSELSLDDCQVALTAQLPNKVNWEAFVWDNCTGQKSNAVAAGASGSHSDGSFITADGKFVIINWGSTGIKPTDGVQGYAVAGETLTHIGMVSNTRGHGSLALDSSGVSWWCQIDDNSARVICFRIPDGYDKWVAQGKPPTCPAAPAPCYRKVLMKLGDPVAVHIGATAFGRDWIVVSTDTGPGCTTLLCNEIMRVYLDSTEAIPHVERLVHHQSDTAYVGSDSPNYCPGLSGYFAQPHATANRLGTEIAYGSSHRQTCALNTYLVTLESLPPPPPSPPPPTPPPAPGGEVPAGIVDPARLILEPPLTRPNPGEAFIDPAFGTRQLRLVDAQALGYPQVTPTSAQLQAWNADQSLIMLNAGDYIILDASTFQVVHTMDLGQTGNEGAPRWSPTDPYVLYYLDFNKSSCSQAAALMRYRLILDAPISQGRELVRCFTEYTRFLRDQSHEELSDDGRFIALMGLKSTSTNKWGYIAEGFVYDLVNDVKYAALEIPVNPQVGPRACDHIRVAPSGRYVLLQCAPGVERFHGLEAYTLEMQYLGKVHAGNGQGDVTRDADGNDVAVIDNVNNAALFTDKHYIVKARIPDGHDAATRGDLTATVKLLALDWSLIGDVSCRNLRAPEWCAVSTYATQTGVKNGLQPFEDEIFKLYLGSLDTAPNVERLAHHRSSPLGVPGRDLCTNFNPWAQPNATANRDGTQILYATNWRQPCDPLNPAETFLVSSRPKAVVNTDLTTIPENMWIKLAPKVFDATGKDITDVGFPAHANSGEVYASGAHAILMFGGGGHGGRRGNDVWLYDIAKNEWRQQYSPDAQDEYPYSKDDSGMTFDEYCQSSANLICNPLPQWAPGGTTKKGRPWTSHTYDQMAYDSENHKLVFFGPNFIFGYNRPYYFGLPDAFTYDLDSKTWTHMAGAPNLYHQSSMAEYDPVNKLVIAVGGYLWTKPGFKYLGGPQVWALDVKTGQWTRKKDPPRAFLDATLVFDTVNNVMLVYGKDYPAGSELWSYDAKSDTWRVVTPAPDPTYGVPPAGSPYAAFDSKNGIMLLWGQGDTGSFIPTWAYNARTNRWEKMNPVTGEPSTSAYQGSHLNYDPVDNVFFLIKGKGQEGLSGGMYGKLGELWVYRYKR